VLHSYASDQDREKFMFKHSIKQTVVSLGSALFTVGTLSMPAHADLTDEILAGIADGSRFIRPEVQSLKTIDVPEPSNLDEFIRDREAAIILGKSLFWDMQVGSDATQACASCHFSSGADPRTKNQRSPGLLVTNQDGSPNPDNTFASDTGANSTLSRGDFPFHKLADPIFFNSEVLSDTNDVISSQGVAFTEFVDAEADNAVETVDAAADPDGFQVGGVNTRRVEPRNTPTVINAVFNHRNFWDGRANNIFNGVSPFGDADPTAFVFKVTKKKVFHDGEFKKEKVLEPVRVSIDNSSLASQAVGPPLSSFEMSANGRYWYEIGDKFIVNDEERGHHALRPLGQQLVDPTDSVLGDLARKHGRPGLSVDSYRKLIKKAFRKEWWESDNFVQLNADGSSTIVDSNVAEHDPDNTYSQMEANFSLFFGLAVQMYEATLVSDDSPVDRFLDGDENALSQAELVGFHLADDEGRCLNCHGQGEFTFAAVSRVNERGITRIRRGDLIDEGFNNIGVRPTLEDLGVGSEGPFGSFSVGRQKHLGAVDATDAELAADLGADGAFKIPTLRNVAETAPYFHNGGETTLEDVIDFYFRGGNFRTFDRANRHPIIGFSADRTEESPITGLGVLRGYNCTSGPCLSQVDSEGNPLIPGTPAEEIGLDDVDKANLVAFLKALTDERVVYRQAPFDGPQLFVPFGHPGDSASVTEGHNGTATDGLVEIPAVGRDGGAPVATFFENL